MTRKINIFGIDITVLTAKEAMKSVIQYLNGESISTVEIVTLEMLMQKKEDEVWKEQVQKFDLLLPGEKALFEAEHSDRTILKDVENRTFLRMFFKYLQKNKKTLFLLAENPEELEQMQKRLQTYTQGMLIVGQAVLPAEKGLEENVINEINGVEPDCILSGLSSPRGEQFVVTSKALLNARLWIGGVSAFAEDKAQRPINRLGQFIRKKAFLCTLYRTKK